MGLGVLLILIPLILYAISAFSIPKGLIKTPDDFFIAYRQIRKTPFSNSSIAYAFQVASVYPFMVWGASRLVVLPFLNAVFWGIGIYLFVWVVPKLKHFMGTDLTLHGYLGTKYGRGVRFWTSILTIIGFSGVALAEIVWGSQVLQVVIPDPRLIYFVMFLLIFFVLIYISYGGQISSIRTDQAQLVFSYLGIIGLLLYLFFIAWKRGSTLDGYSFAALVYILITIPLLFILRRAQFLVNKDATGYGKLITVFSNFLMISSLGGLFLAALLNLRNTNFKDFGGVNQLQGFGYMGLLSLIFLPLFWQFVDMTNWQRILAFKPSTDDTAEMRVEELQRGLLIYAVESPFTWVIFTILGLIILLIKPDLTATDVFVNLPMTFVRSTSALENIFGFSFIISILAIMLSTVDSVIAAVMFTFVYDTFRPTRKIVDRKDSQELRDQSARIIAVGRFFGLIALVAGVGIYILFDVWGKGGAIFIGMLFAFYTAQLSFLPAVLGALLVQKRKLPTNVFVGISIAVGAVGGIGLGLYSTFRNPDYTWYPVMFTLLTSSLIYCLGFVKK